MISKFLQRLTAPAPAPQSDSDARLALGALLVRLARADGDYAPEEIAQIDATLAARFGLSDEATKALRLECEAFEAKAPDTVRFTRAIKDAVDLDHRVGVIEAMWAVVMADGERDNAEDSNMRMIASLLGVSDKDSNAARLRVTPA
ncbi:TerB family tellurite resistance protein [Yoonia sp. I 8.24]|uniref:tellurite resistance TerB family protein n=1 Tax=Yoonia sp. I 8.24 TaxID=1537229 RepID=UPI001EDEF5DB|nr:TerB family tellurite resistance protein [Yoonia sp. I 8.24]MCG3267210.1 TerB family tellurite resistance protein [Yoonia sp. I 8.24]